VHTCSVKRSVVISLSDKNASMAKKLKLMEESNQVFNKEISH
jgi:hypothetical protein